MREIRFRAWDEESKKWIYFNVGQRYSLRVDATTIGQYIGLKDKNDKEIYEGDIVEWKYKDTPIVTEVIFRQGCFSAGNNIPIKEYIHQEFKVIGNIYENPELLEKK